jgi:hypothetical protein
MENTTAGRAAELVEWVLQDTDDDEHRFKLRTALQLLEVVQEQQEAVNQTLAGSDLDEQTRENLQELGYLE